MDWRWFCSVGSSAVSGSDSSVRRLMFLYPACPFESVLKKGATHVCVVTFVIA